MADKITNIEAYRKASALHGDTVENIRIEDPLDFLDATEKDQYNAARRRDAEKLTKQTEQEEKEASSAARAMSERERMKLKEATDDPLMERRPRRSADPYEEDDAEEADDDYDDDDEDEDDDYDEDEDYDDDDEEDDDDGEDSHGLLIAAGIMAFLIVIVLLFMLWIVFLMPRPEEPEAEERAIQEAQIQEEAAKEREKSKAVEEDGEDEEEEEIILVKDYRMLLPDGYEDRVDMVEVTAKSGLKLRRAPDTGSDNVETIVPLGESLTRIAEDPVQGWSAVVIPEYDGVLFCSSDYLITQ